MRNKVELESLDESRWKKIHLDKSFSLEGISMIEEYQPDKKLNLSVKKVDKKRTKGGKKVIDLSIKKKKFKKTKQKANAKKKLETWKNKYIKRNDKQTIEKIYENSELLKKKMHNWISINFNKDEKENVKHDSEKDFITFNSYSTNHDENVDVQQNTSDIHVDIDECILQSLLDLNFIFPTKIQKYAILPALSYRRDIIAAAPTGSGKTLAFGVPIVCNIFRALQARENKLQHSADENIIKQNQEKGLRRCECLIIVPSRELSNQICEHISKICTYTSIDVLSIVGGLSVQKQVRLLAKIKPHIIVGTVGRLNSLMTSSEPLQDEGDHEGLRYIQEISKLRFIVIDEADKFIEEHDLHNLTNLIRFIYEKIKSTDQIQTFLFSATLTLPYKGNNQHSKSPIKILTENLKFRKKKLKIIDLVSDKAHNFITEYEIEENKQKKKPNQHFSKILPDNLKISYLTCQDEDKEFYVAFFMLKYLYYVPTTEKCKILVFVNSISYVLRLEPILNLMIGKDKHENKMPKILRDKKKKNYHCEIVGLHSNMTQKQRLQKMERFIKSSRALLICTDIASRGIDFLEVNFVLNMHIPHNSSIFTHRAGRTARANNSGECLCFCSDKDLSKWAFVLQGIGINFGNLLSFEGFKSINSKEFSDVKKRYKLAVEIESQEHKLDKKTTETNWLKKAAQECEIEIDDNINDDETDHLKFSHILQKLKSRKSLLSQMMLHQI